jgi:predicted amidohydrolase YtcJ
MAERAEVILVGRIASLAGDEGFGWVEAIAVAGGRVIAAGSAADVAALGTAGTRRIELSPEDVAIPGLTDAHLHLAEGGLSAEQVDLSTSPSLDDGLRLIAGRHTELPAGAWLVGHGWLADRWGRWPTAAALEEVAPGRPAALWAHDHHSLWVNETALATAAIGPQTADPPGGRIGRDADRRATGVLYETAARLVRSHVPPPSADDCARAIADLGRRLLALGVTGAHDPGALSLQTGLGPGIDGYRVLASSGRLPVRVHVCVREEQLEAAIEAGLRSGDPLPGGDDGDRLRFGWLKLFADGTLGSRTAAMLEPFEEEPGVGHANAGLGIWMTEPARLAGLADKAAVAGIATAIHAIGDRAVQAAVDALVPTGARTAAMPRIEHVQLVTGMDVRRLAQGGVAASIQPIHLRSDAAAARRLWGKRAEANGYRLRSLHTAGAVVAFGTDAPVEPIDPWPGLEIAVTRRAAEWGSDAQAFGQQEAVSLDQAIRDATVGPATVAGRPDVGRLIPGSLADIVVLPAGALREPIEIRGPLGRTRPRLVLVGGEVAFEA